MDIDKMTNMLKPFKKVIKGFHKTHIATLQEVMNGEIKDNLIG